MASVTLKVLDGADRGRVFANLATPVSIGREEGNTIQLNDERISRFHVKIQEDQDKLVLTDLASTNGTKVNGEDIQLRILRFGDRITVGRSVLWFGTAEEIAQRLKQLREAGGKQPKTRDPNEPPPGDEAELLDFELDWSADPSERGPLHSLEPPELPERLSPGQAAQLAELLEYINLRIRWLGESVDVNDKRETVTLDTRQWQNLLDLQMKLATYLRGIGGPGEGEA